MDYYPYQTADEMCADMGEGVRNLWPSYVDDRARYGHNDDAHVKAWEAQPFHGWRPFRFEDLNGRPEPASWGPLYPKTASAAVEKWRVVARGRELSIDEKYAYGEAVGQWIRALNNPAAKRHAIPESDLHYRFSIAKWNGAIRARFATLAAAERRAWCEGRAKSKLIGHEGLTIGQAYARAMAEKRPRLAALEPIKAAA